MLQKSGTHIPNSVASLISTLFVSYLTDNV